MRCFFSPAWLSRRIMSGRSDHASFRRRLMRVRSCDGGSRPCRPPTIRRIDSVEDVLKVGDKVLFGKYSGTEITVEGEEYLMLKEEDIVAIIR